MMLLCHQAKATNVLTACPICRRTIRLPPSANLDKIDAQYKDGVLRINIPKKEAASTQKTIKVQNL